MYFLPFFYPPVCFPLSFYLIFIHWIFLLIQLKSYIFSPFFVLYLVFYSLTLFLFNACFSLSNQKVIYSDTSFFLFLSHTFVQCFLLILLKDYIFTFLFPPFLFRIFVHCFSSNQNTVYSHNWIFLDEKLTHALCSLQDWYQEARLKGYHSNSFLTWNKHKVWSVLNLSIWLHTQYRRDGPNSNSTDETNLVLFPLTIWLQSFTREMQILSSYFRLKNHLAWRSYNKLVLNFISFTLKHFLKACCLENWFHLEDLYLVYNIATAFLI